MGNRANGGVRFHAIGLFIALIALVSYGGATLPSNQLVSTSAPTLYISSTGSDSSNCTSEASPCQSLAYATTQASAGATIEILGNAYLNATSSQTPFTLPRSISPLTITSPSPYGYLTPTPSEAGTIYGSGMVVPAGMDVTFTGIKIAGFMTQDNLGGGGALYVDQGASVTIDNCILVQNQALEVPTTPSSYASGGAILNQGSVRIMNSAFLSNTVTTPALVSTPGTLQGGAIYNLGTMSLVNTIMRSNGLNPVANQSYSLSGGAILNAGTMSIASSTINSNGANAGSGMGNSALEGGAISNVGGLSIVDSEIVNNSLFTKAQSSTLEGAGIFNSGVISELALSTIMLNQSNGTSNPTGVGLYTTTIGSFSTQAPVGVAGTVIGQNYVGGTNTLANCSATGAGAVITSLGYNVSDNTDCGFTTTSDQQNATLNYTDEPAPFNTEVFEPVGLNPWAYAIPLSATANFGSNTLLLCPGVDQLSFARPQPGQSQCSAGSIEPGTNQVSPVPPVFTSSPVAFFTVGSPGSFNVLASGTPQPIYTISSGNLPQGLTLDETTGVLSGTPASGSVGTTQLSLTANNGTGTTATQSLSLVIEPVPVTISTNALIQGSKVVATAQVTPQGSTLSAAGTLTFTAKVKNQSLGSCQAIVSTKGAASCTLTLTSTPSGSAAEIVASYVPNSSDLGGLTEPIGTVTLGSAIPSGLIGGQVGAPLPTATYGAALLTPANASWSITNGSLPLGVSVATATGAFTGSPMSAGSFSATLGVRADGLPTPLSVPITFSISKALPQVTLHLPNSTQAGSAVVVGASVVGSGPTATGTITFSAGGQTCQGVLVEGDTSCTLIAPNTSQSLTASYGGDANYLGATGTQTWSVSAPPASSNPGSPTGGSSGQSPSSSPLSVTAVSPAGPLSGTGVGGVVVSGSPTQSQIAGTSGQGAGVTGTGSGTTPTSIASGATLPTSTGKGTSHAALGSEARSTPHRSELPLVLGVIALVVLGAGAASYQFLRARGGKL